jgi:hypothetical protein
MTMITATERRRAGHEVARAGDPRAGARTGGRVPDRRAGSGQPADGRAGTGHQATGRVSTGRGPAGTPALGPPGPPPIPRTAYDLLADAGRGLGRAIRAGSPAERYAAAHLAALRGAAAVLAARAKPRRSARGSAWELLPRVAPELAEWAAFFAAGSAKRQAAVAGVTAQISAREADDMVRQSAAFLDLVDQTLGAG